ncbi:putative F-box protein At2g36090 [Silene latifolia]|uniref:putative F-box protein At2g36090 n=1 Tax=Silene latifolia TaxID=37657 RepID=UPI003D78A738
MVATQSMILFRNMDKSDKADEPTTTTTTSSTSSKFSFIPHDVIRSHILPHLDGCTLASISSTTPELRTLISSDQKLWSHLCHSTWPSTNTPRIRHLISTFPGGPRTFYSLSYPTLPPTLPLNLRPPSPSHQLISAVDLFYRGKCIFSKVQENETVTGWFRCSPFRIDLLDPKESVPTPIRRPSHDDTCRELYSELELSWVLVCPTRRLSLNVSSLKPVNVDKHWLSGEVHVRYAVVVDNVVFVVDVTCVGCGPGGLVLHVTEVCLKMEDLDGVGLIGKDSLVILQRVFEGKRGNGKLVGVEQGKKRYLEYLDRRKEWKENQLKREGRLDGMCVVFGVGFIVSLFCWSLILALLLKVMSLFLFRTHQMRTRNRFVPS